MIDNLTSVKHTYTLYPNHICLYHIFLVSATLLNPSTVAKVTAICILYFTLQNHYSSKAFSPLWMVALTLLTFRSPDMKHWHILNAVASRVRDIVSITIIKGKLLPSSSLLILPYKAELVVLAAVICLQRKITVTLENLPISSFLHSSHFCFSLTHTDISVFVGETVVKAVQVLYIQLPYWLSLSCLS